MASRRIQVEIIGDARSLKAALGSSAAGLGTFEKRANRLGTSMQRVGATMTRNVTLPVLGLAAAATKMALDYDRAMNHVQALTGASAKQTKAWSDQILKLGPRIGQSPQQLAEALYFVASSGAKVNQVMPITAASAKLAAAGMGDAQVVAQLLTSAMNAYGPKALSAAKSSDILTEAIKVGKAEPAEFAMELGKVIPVAQNMGISFAEVSGITASLTNTGLDAATATTGLRNIMLKMMAPTAGSTKELKKLGLSVADLQNEVKTKGLIATLQDLNGRVDGNRQAMHKLLPDARGLTAALALIGPNADRAAGAVDKVEHSTGAAAKAFRIAQKGPAQQFQRELAQLQTTAVKLGNDLLPVVIDVLTTVGDLADSFDHLSETEKHAIEIGLGVAALVGPITSVGGSVAILVGWFSKLRKAAAGAAVAEEAAAGGAAAGGLALGPLAAAAAAAAAGYLLWSHRATSTLTVNKEFTAAQSRLNDQIRTGQMNVTGWNQVMQRSTTLASADQKVLKQLADAGFGDASKKARDAARSGLRQFIGQMQAVSVQAGAASRDTEHFGAAARAQYAHIAAVARATANLAAAMNSVPNQKYVQLVVDVTQHLRTEGLAPGQGRETGAGLGTFKAKPTPPSKLAAPVDPLHGKPNRASGGVIMAGRNYIVGDTAYPETFTSDVPGHISRGGVGHGGGGWVEVRFTDWERGIGLMRMAGDASVAAGARKRRQLDRMGSG